MIEEKEMLALEVDNLNLLFSEIKTEVSTESKGDTKVNSNQNPAIDPSEEDTLVGAFRFIVGKMLQDTNGMLPAKVIAFDRTANRVSVQPLIAILTSDGSQVSRAQIASLPVLQLGGGGYFLGFNLNPGDLGWIAANDRDISLFLQSYSEAQPNSYRKNNFADSVFIPDIMKGFTIDAEDSEHAVFQNASGTVRVALWPNKVKITAPMGLEVDGPLSANGGFTISGGTGETIDITGNLKITGNIHTIGNIDATGDITPHVPP